MSEAFRFSIPFDYSLCKNKSNDDFADYEKCYIVNNENIIFYFKEVIKNINDNDFDSDSDWNLNETEYYEKCKNNKDKIPQIINTTWNPIDKKLIT